MFFAEKAKSHAINQLLHLLSFRARSSHFQATTLAQLAVGSLSLVQSAAIVTLTLHSLATSKPAIGSGLFYLLFSLGSSYRKKGKEQGMYFDIKKYKNAIETRINPLNHQ
jgi:hypothetical protein